MHLASAYGLGIQSAIPLPELSPGCSAVDVRISFANLSGYQPANTDSVVCDVRGLDTYIWWPGTGAFLVREGRAILVDPLPEAEERVVRLHLLSFAVHALLRQRGFLVLHGSSLARGGRAVAFLGASRSGKSTIAGLLLSRGYHLLADDLVALTYTGTTGQELVVVPGVPQIKLWPDSAEVLGHDLASLDRLHPLHEKRDCRIASAFAAQPTPLDQVYALATGPAMEIERLAPQPAIRELIRHTARIALLPLADPTTHLRQCAGLVDRVPVSRLTLPRTFASLPALAAMIDRGLPLAH